MKTSLRILPMLFILVVFCESENPATKPTQFQDNILKKFLEGVMEDDEHSQFTTTGKEHKAAPAVQKPTPETKKKTIILANIGTISQLESSTSNPSEAAKQKAKKAKKHASKPHQGSGDLVSSGRSRSKPAAEDQTPKPDIQPELTFETPTSATFLLKSLDTKKEEMSLGSAEIKEIKEGLKALEGISKELEALKTKLASVFKSLYQPEKTEKESKPPTDLLNYNFIEVTEARPSEKK